MICQHYNLKMKQRILKTNKIIQNKLILHNLSNIYKKDVVAYYFVPRVYKAYLIEKKL